MAPAYNPLLLSSVKPELDVSLAAVLREQEQFFSSGGKHGLDTALTELHRLRSVLEMLNLHGLQAFCGEIETLLQELVRQPGGATVLHQDALRHALFGLTHYLDALENGAPNAALRLFPEYQELHQVRGVEMAFEVDLFFPELDVELPPELRTAPVQDQAAARIKQARMHFQQGLLKWLRQDDTLDALRAMSAALQVVLACVPPAQRAFWWVAHGLLACVQLDGIPPELNAKKSFSRIDQRMRALLDGSAFDELQALSEMLYLVARSHTVNETVEHIKQAYDLDAYLPEAAPLPVGQTTAVLEQLRGQLNQANEAWEQCTLNDRAACQRFAELAGQLYAQAEQLDRNTLQFLCKQIHTTAQHVEGPEHAPAIAMDMAMALLLLDGGIEHYQHLGSGFHEQVRLLTARLHEALTDRPEDQTKLAHLVALYCEMEQREVMAPLAKEMQDNLQHIEQTLNAFFGNAAKRNELLQVNRLLSQVQGGLHILTLDIAEQLLVTLRQIAERYHQGDSPTTAEMRAVATAISTLEDYVHGLTLGQKPEATALEAVLKDLLAANSGHAETAGEVPEEEPAATVVTIRSGDEDAELLEVFLEEAQEVMETLRANLEIARLHMDSREPWITMRRGFHTLKGSGRMVGLTDLGEVAWAVERAMNKWIAANQPATPDLLELVGDAEVLFQHWVDMLKSGSTSAQIDTAHLLTLADCIEHDKPLPRPAVPASTQAAPEVPATIEQPQAELAAVAPEAEGPVVIGEVSISPMLFNIASEEALEHAQKLRDCFEAMQDAAQPVVSYDFMRAAHTLAGVNRTMGFLPIAELAYTLEMWLEPRIDRSGVIGTPQLVLVDDVITRLNELCQGVRARQAPAPQGELIARLQADKLQTANEVPQEAPAATMLVADQAVLVEPVLAAPEPESPTTPVESASVEPAPAATPPVAQEQHERTVHDEIDEQLLPIFLEEAHELYPQIGSTLRAWRSEPTDAQLGRNLQRSLHTLKGSARMAGAMRLGELTHRVEDRVSKAVNDNVLDDVLWSEMDNYLDRIAHAIEQLGGGGEAVVETSAPAVAEVPAAPAPIVPASTTEPATAASAAEVPASAPATPAAALEVGAERAMQSALLRVRSDVVDRLVNEAGEVSVARSRAEAELREFRTSVLELTDSVNRLRKQLREIEIQAESQMQARTTVSGELEQKFDPLEFDRFTRFQELTRFMNESVHDVQTVQQTLLKNLDETAAALTAQSHLNRDLQQGLMSIRMVPFASISERLYRIVRQTGKELNKRANLELSGTEIELDRSVLEKMTAPFEHLLRNAIAHGLEAPEQRTAAGKPAIGEIRFSLHQESNEVVFELADDGAGLNLARIRQKALDHGLLAADEEVADEQLMQLIFTAGLSTAGEVTEIAGRGVGLDVVRSEVSALGGRVDVSSELGKGVRFTIHLPLTLAVTRTLMVRAAQAVYALPASMVEHVQQVKPEALDALYHAQQVEWQGRRYPLFYLPRVLGDEQAELVSQPHNPVLLLRSGEQRIALHVDSLLGNQEVVVKNIGPQLARLPGIAGATVAGDGSVILIINPVAFTQRLAVTRKVAKAPTRVVEEVHHQPLVMVVDDSLTVRKITSRLLERSGYQVVTAKDGVDALEQLMEIEPDMMLLDIEMPRMDGFELAKRLRQDSKTRALPIIMITSRTADKHRNYALELGVNEYLGKPYQEDELLGHIARFVNARTA